MTKVSYSGLKYGKSDVEIKLLVDIQNDWFEVNYIISPTFSSKYFKDSSILSFLYKFRD